MLDGKLKKSSEFIYNNDTPVAALDTMAFNTLTLEEQRYIHYLSKASWFGFLIVLFQTSPESPLIFVLFHRLFSNQSIDELKSLAINKAKLSEQEWRAFLVYVAAFYSNMGNYRGIGDSKFIPDLSMEKLEHLIKCSDAYRYDSSFVDFLWNNLKFKMFSLKPNELLLGFYPNCITTYWSKNMTVDDEGIVKKFLLQNGLEAYNTRTMKDQKTGEYVIRFASIRETSDPDERDYMDKINVLQMDQHRFRLERGDYSNLLSLVNKYLKKAQYCTQNKTEQMMIEKYIHYFRSGSLDAHKEGSRYWIKNKGPMVETYIGFIETYRDPAGQRAEFEGFVAMVNKEMSKKFSKLVDNAWQLLPLLPWPHDFEKDKFLQPDFTSLDVLTFAGTLIPHGINIPNYDDIRQNEGFKNVFLNNVMAATLKKAKRNFLNTEDEELLDKYSLSVFEIMVGLHELLGHGTGKLFQSTKEGVLNFDPSQTINPLTGNAVNKWYEWSESYDSKFASLSSPYEECRAECVALYLSLNNIVLNIFGIIDAIEINNVVHACWLEMVRRGIESLEMYNPTVKKWFQAHSQARYVITRVLFESAKEILSIEYIDQSPNDGQPDLRIMFTGDLHLIETKGRQAIGNFLLKLQVYKSTGDIESAHRMFDYYSSVNDELEYPYLKFRDIVISRKKPRQLFVQSSTSMVDSIVQLKTFESSHEGLIQSYQEHFANEPYIESLLVNLWKKDSICFN